MMGEIKILLIRFSGLWSLYIHIILLFLDITSSERNRRILDIRIIHEDLESNFQQLRATPMGVVKNMVPNAILQP